MDGFGYGSDRYQGNWAVDFLPFVCFTKVDADVGRERGFTHLGCHRGELARIDDEIVRIFREFVGRIGRRWIRGPSRNVE